MVSLFVSSFRSVGRRSRFSMCRLSVGTGTGTIITLYGCASVAVAVSGVAKQIFFLLPSGIGRRRIMH